MTTNDDRSHRLSSGCHVAQSDVATGLRSYWGLWVSLELVLGVVGHGGRDWPLVFMSEGIADGG